MDEEKKWMKINTDGEDNRVTWCHYYSLKKLRSDSDSGTNVCLINSWERSWTLEERKRD